MKVCYFCGQQSTNLKKCPKCEENYCELHIETSWHDCPLIPIVNPYEIVEENQSEFDSTQNDNITSKSVNPEPIRDYSQYSTKKDEVYVVSSSAQDKEEEDKAFLPTTEFKSYIKCPFCAENVPKDLKSCKKCGEKFDSKDWDLQALILYEQGKSDEAILLGSRAAELDPTNKDAWYHLGNYYLSPDAKNLENAMKCYEKVVELDASSAVNDVRFDLGVFYMGKGRNPEAIRLFKKVISAGEEAFFEKVLELNPKEQQHWVTIANAFQEMDIMGKAKACFQKAVKMDPNYKKDTVIDLGG